MATENSRVLYIERSTGVQVVGAELNALADDTAAVAATPSSNDASTERALLADFLIVLGVQAARAADATVSLLIVPEVNSTYGDTATLKTASSYIARYADGTPVTLTLDAAVTARSMSVAGVQLPNANFKVGLLNATGQALAATLNTVWMSGTYGPASITV